MGPDKCNKIKNDIFVIFNYKQKRCLIFLFLLKDIIHIKKMNV